MDGRRAHVIDGAVLLARRTWLAGVATLAWLEGCRKIAPLGVSPVSRAFYYWRTTFRLSAVESEALGRLGVSRLYVRALDVDAEGTGPPQPVARLGVPAASTFGGEIVPVAFLRARALAGTRGDTTGVKVLGASLWDELRRTADVFGQSPREVQLDCDWTLPTRDAFFALCAEVANRAAAGGCHLSTTIRLHQVKHRERTGVPPAARGMLMFYNMGALDADATSEAIFDAAKAAPYLARVASYPLPLDVALPLWSWVVQVRGDRVVGLLQHTGEAELRRQPWLAAAEGRRFIAREHGFLAGVMVREGDALDLEGGDAAQSLAAASLLAPHLTRSGRPRTVSLFDLSEKNLARHDLSSLDRLYSSLG